MTRIEFVANPTPLESSLRLIECKGWFKFKINKLHAGCGNGLESVEVLSVKRRGKAPNTMSDTANEECALAWKNVNR